MIISWKKFLFTINEFYGDHIKEDPKKRADLHGYYYLKHPLHQNNWFTIHRKLLTFCVNLDNPEETLRKGMNRTTRNQINKAIRDGVTIQVINKPTSEDIEEYSTFFNPFAIEKEIKPCRKDKLICAKENNMLVITYVLHKDGRKLAGHAYITNGKKALMFYSCSGRFANSDIPGTVISRANRYLHWYNIVYFKNVGYEIYDFMGLTTDPNNHSQQNINRFKKGFCGEEKIEYQSFIPQNIKGYLLIIALKILWRNQHEIIRKGKIITPIKKSI